MNPLAIQSNEAINKAAPAAFALLSNTAQRLFFPKGILSQSAEAKDRAHKFNATIGTATEAGGPMYLQAAGRYFTELSPAEIFPYAPPAGRPGLREAWRKKMVQDNPGLKGKAYSLPIVTSAITHGLSLVGQLFLNPDDRVIAPDKIWGNYKLTFETVLEARIETFAMFDAQGGFNLDGFQVAVREEGRRSGKVIALLNFPNNPTGYTPTVEEAQSIVEILKAEAALGTKILSLSDDSYFGLFYENSTKESLFAQLADAHPNILAVKLDGATKEYYAWGFRTGFLTFGHVAGEPLFAGLEQKVKGAIRAGISNCCHASQTVTEKMLKDPDLSRQWQEKFEIMKTRALEVKRVLDQPEMVKVLKYYPFNSGYFMCLKLEGVDAETLRLHLLDKYGVGAISIGSSDLRVAFSCIETQDIAELFSLIRQGVLDLKA